MTSSSGRHRGGRDDQGVVAGGPERRWAGREDARSLVVDERGLAVHGAAGTHDLAAVGGADALMAQAHARGSGCVAPEPPDDVGRDAGLGGGAGARAR